MVSLKERLDYVRAVYVRTILHEQLGMPVVGQETICQGLDVALAE